MCGTENISISPIRAYLEQMAYNWLKPKIICML